MDVDMDILSTLTPEQIAIVESVMPPIRGLNLYPSGTPEYYRAYRVANRERVLAKERAYRDRQGSSYAERIKAWHDAHHDRDRKYALKKNYGLSEQAYNDLMTAQNNVCAVCGRSLLDMPRRSIHVDHDHLTERIRGIVCNGCNTKIGVVESPLFPRVMAYVARNV